MKIHFKLIILFVFTTVLFSCHHNELKKPSNVDVLKHPELKKSDDPQDTITSFHKISKSNSVNLSEVFTDVNYTFLYKETLYLLGSGTKNILMMDTKTGEIKTAAKLNKLIDSVLAKIGFPDKLFINSGRMYIGFDKGIICIDNSHKIIFSIETFYNHFSVTACEELIVLKILIGLYIHETENV